MHTSTSTAPLNSPIGTPPYTLRLPRSTLRPRTTVPTRLHPCQEVREPTDDHLDPSPSYTKKFAVYGFLPLASIAASPVCTPAVVSPRLALHHSPELTSSSGRPRYSNGCSPASSPSNPLSLCPSSPPISLSKSSTATLKPSSPSSAAAQSQRSSIGAITPFSTSASFPASMLPHVPKKHDMGLKRGVSVPDMSPQSQVSSEPFPSSKRARTSHGPHVSRIQTANLSSFRSVQETKETFATHNRLTPPSPVNRTIPSPGDIHFPEKTKDAIRKYHALKELLSTEVGYLIDLRIFVSVYLRNLSTLTSRSPTTSTFRSSMSFTAGPWMNSYSQLQAATTSDSPGVQLFTSASLKESFKTRSLLSDNEIETLSRNAEDLLQLHEEFVDELRERLTFLGFSMKYDENAEFSTGADDYQTEGIVENVEAAIRIVSGIFISKASHFKRYESFCAGHPEALDLVRKTLQQHGSAWEAYGQRCSGLVSGLLVDTGAVTPSDSPQIPLPNPMPIAAQTSSTMSARRRAISLSSSDATIRPLRRRISGVLSNKDTVVLPTVDTRRERSARRIEFMDYMIKPVQRICRYPLLLDQLKPSKTLRLGPLRRFEALSDVDELVDRAAQAMRDVAASVDDARHRQDIATRSSLIISRIYLSGSLMTSTSRNPISQNLTLDFFSSLGNCLIAGSLDVLHHHPLVSLDACSTLTAKYLGAFLYPGGYMILAKVCRGKKYEPKHWFSLLGFELADVEDEEAMLAFSFRLTSEDQVYELGAGCKREKDAWMAAIREAISQTSTWVNEPTASYRFDSKGDYIGAFVDGELKTGSETANNTDNECAENITICRRRTRMRNPWRPGTTTRGERPLTSGSMKSMFTPITVDDEDIELRRPATTARLQVDQDLQDVMSQVCLNARSYAFSHEEELFPPPISTRAPLPRSNSAMSISGMAKTRLTRYDSVRIPKRKCTVDGSDMQASLVKATTLGSRRKAKRLSLSSLPMKENRGSPVESYPTPPSSQASSTAPSFVVQYDFVKSISSPSGSSVPSSTSTPPLTRRGSLVQNVREFFTISPMTALSNFKPSLRDPEPRSSSRNQNHAQSVLEHLIKRKSIRTGREVNVQ